ncbi:unnamed protein product [Psylliodes chrysocephalus]|uniref:Ig-like domain-containing protein n=1 Tax=Psylliodes chrysocephalus TaxID=3402493 RepID=A0A9P0D157_9CUCU|nr:unnamed protein product [Psylliodes chrysocephala]
MTLLWILEVVFVLSFLIGEVFPLKNVLLTIEPQVVPIGNSSTLKCTYDLQDDALYTVKWYRGVYEFYRYTPSEHPKSQKIFPYKEINVDESASNSTQVVLRNIDFILSGNFTCEVTTDASHLTTGYDTKPMLVVQTPETAPTISVFGEPLDYGDILRANCSSPPARPRASLTFFLNNYTVARSEPLLPHHYQKSEWSDLSLVIRLYEEHFSGGRLVLRCVADVENVYHEEAVLKLGSVREPVPERVSAQNTAISSSQQVILRIIVFVNIMLLSS